MKHYLGLSLILITLAAISLFLLRHCEDATMRVATNLSKTFQSVLQVQPEIRINQRVIMTQTSPIAELAIVSREEGVSYVLNEKWRLFNHNIPLTEKTLTAQADYRIKAGFNLREPFLVTIDSATGKINAQLPKAKILSVERIGTLTLKDNDALLNRITPEERERVLNELDQVARHAAETSGLVEDAEKQATERLTELSLRNGQPIEILPIPRS